MSDSMEVRKQRYKDWAKDNLGEKTGIWYAPYLEKLGSLLNRFLCRVFLVCSSFLPIKK